MDEDEEDFLYYLTFGYIRKKRRKDVDTDKTRTKGYH